MTQVAIVTGGGKGIGAAIVLQLLSENYRVVIADIDFQKIEHTNLLFVKTDVRRESAIQNLIKKSVGHFGQLDLLVNNAGLVIKESEKFEHLDLKKWNNYVSTDLTAPFLLSKYAVPYLRKTKGNIINIASTRFMQSEGNHEAYAACKGGLVSLTHELAITLGPDIRVNAISPGWINSHNEKLKKSDHAQHPVGRVGLPEDIAHMVSFLASDKASFITGQNFIVDGGMTVKMIYK